MYSIKLVYARDTKKTDHMNAVNLSCASKEGSATRRKGYKGERMQQQPNIKGN